jgi:predicted nucleic acid-binding protein
VSRDDTCPLFHPTEVGETGRTPLFVDTNAIVAHYYPQSAKHDEVREVIEAIGAGELPYCPLLTNRYVLDEVVSLLLSRADTDVAHEALNRLLAEETFRILDVDPGLVDRAVDQFREYDDQEISLTDHVIAEQARDYDVEHLFTYDGDFRTLGFTVIPYKE